MNYQLKLEEILKANKDKTPTLLLHSCCVPCSSYVLEYLTNYFYITILFYNPNISSKEEYEKRLNELKRLVKKLPHSNKIEIIEGRYDQKEFISSALDDSIIKEEVTFEKIKNNWFIEKHSVFSIEMTGWTIIFIIVGFIGIALIVISKIDW